MGERPEYRTVRQRFAGPIDSADEAKVVVREMSVVLLIVAGLLFALSRQSGVIAPVAAVCIAVPASLLLASRHRYAAMATFAAVVLVVVGLFTLGAVPGSAMFFWAAALGVAGRANRAALKLHRFECAPAAEKEEVISGA